MARFLVVFLVLLAVLFTVELLEPVQQHVVQPFTAAARVLFSKFLSFMPPLFFATTRLSSDEMCF